MKRFLLLMMGMLLVFSAGCKGTDQRIQNVRFEGSYLNDNSGSDPFNFANGSHRTGAEGLEGTKLTVLGGGEVARLFDNFRVDVYAGPSLLMPNGGNYVGSPEVKYVDKDDDSWAIGAVVELDLVYDNPEWFVNPLVSFGGGAHYTHHKWDGQGTNYIFSFSPRVGLEFEVDTLAEGGTIQFTYGIDHYSNGRGRTRNSNDGRNTDTFTVVLTVPF